MLQGEAIATSTPRGRVWQGAKTQMPLLQAPEQVQGQHSEAHRTCTPKFAVPVFQRLIIHRPYSLFFLLGLG